MSFDLYLFYKIKIRHENAVTFKKNKIMSSCASHYQGSVVISWEKYQILTSRWDPFFINKEMLRFISSKSEITCHIEPIFAIKILKILILQRNFKYLYTPSVKNMFDECLQY